MPNNPTPTPSYQKLHSKWTSRNQTLRERLVEKHKDSLEWLTDKIPGKEHIAAGSLTGLLLFAPPIIASAPEVVPTSQQSERPAAIPPRAFLVTELSSLLPQTVTPLSPDQETQITDRLSERAGFEVKAELEGKRLNTSYGYIGAEQHLMRYPGDTIYSHFTSPDEATKYSRSGMAPGRGAWGYFASSQSALTQKDIDREKYYIAVQTFMAPGFNENVHEYYTFFRYRKMLVVNPQTGKAMVTVIGDAGPAVWTGKQLGGSPEVMSYLERVDGKARGPVLYFFINDPEDKVPLGPIEL